ncbi:lytic transglycosylase [Paraferrimonas haliotis]|uniref:Lytic transglycosylase n=1 Tax=Paraferrimonas haliotis TaxID=2013866 RepID=A0AA37X023_9GAMM|nr:LysM peptidoglycan-binding domain-containing protein [Paraferrimonas haliotis]GLS84486.1 lytic transglycosylase [Paraferrimonas haliotis]
MRQFVPTALVAALLLAGCQSSSTITKQPEPLPTEPTNTAPANAAVVETPPKEPVKTEQAVVIEDVWQRMRMQMHMPIPQNKRVQTFENWYKRNPKHLARVSKRAEPYMYYIMEQVEARGLPMELALLPIIESAFAPYAISHVGASGFWQFTKPTAKHFGLHMDWWYDGRHDVIAATDAALDMLEYLYRRLDNNWLYAVAAYNSGEGRVMRSIRRNKQQGLATDFWSLNLPSETEKYVPQLLALADVIKNPDQYGITLFPIANKPVVEAVDAGSQIDLAFAADMANMSVQELQKLNSGYMQWATSPNGPHNILLPIDRVETFNNALANTDANARIKWQRYQIKNGDSLSVIAQRHKTSVDIIKQINGMNNNRIVAGKHLLIPVAAKDLSQYPLSLAQRQQAAQAASAPNKINHVIQAGDSLWKIGQQYNVSYKKIARWNNMAENAPLRPGRTLVVYSNSAKVTSNGVIRTITYRVRKGDSLSLIASRFNVTVKQLKQWNQFDSKYLQPGQRLKVHVDITKVNV